MAQRSDETAQYEAGKHAGRLWVTKKQPPASSEELDRLDEFHRAMEGSTDWDIWFSDGGLVLSAFTTAERLYFILTPYHDGDRDEAQSFWEFVAWPHEMDDISPSFVEGFVIGVLEVRDEMATSE